MERKKKHAPMRILQPGERNEFWQTILRIRDSGDPRWSKTFSPAFKMAAEAYERNLNCEHASVEIRAAQVELQVSPIGEIGEIPERQKQCVWMNV
jgi:hypothetical protein